MKVAEKMQIPEKIFLQSCRLRECFSNGFLLLQKELFLHRTQYLTESVQGHQGYKHTWSNNTYC